MKGLLLQSSLWELASPGLPSPSITPGQLPPALWEEVPCMDYRPCPGPRAGFTLGSGPLGALGYESYYQRFQNLPVRTDFLEHCEWLGARQPGP